MDHDQSNLKNLYRVKPEQGRGKYLRLDMNENPEGLPEEFVNRVLKKITPDLLAMYPEAGKLINKISSNIGIESEYITVANGSDEAIKAIFEAFGNSQKSVVTVYPTFAMYEVYTKLYNMEHKKIEYNQSFEISHKDICNAIDKNTAIVALLNPNNPIGNVYTSNEIRAIINTASSCGAIVIIDEAYHYFHDISYLSMANEFDNVIVLRTFSKVFSLAGCRIGYAVAKPEIIDLLDKVRPTYNVNSIALEFAMEIIQSNSLLDELVTIERQGRNYIKAELAENGYDYYGENGNYVFIKPRKDKNFVVEELKRRGILVKTYSIPLLKDYFRISTGSKEIMSKFWQEFYSIDWS